ncbi:MAG: hypothetical protein AAB772_00305 [Patescibacteria group bacterium]
MENEKRKFLVVGEIEANGKRFKKYTWAYSKAQAVWLVGNKLQERYPKMKVYLINVEARDITYLNENDVKIYAKIITI